MDRKAAGLERNSRTVGGVLCRPHAGLTGCNRNVKSRDEWRLTPPPLTSPRSAVIFVEKAVAACAAPALKYFCSILHHNLAFTQNLGLTQNNAKIEISEPVLPAVPADNTMEEIKPLSIGTGLDDWIVLLSERVYLKSASSTTNATPFAAFTLDPYKMGTQIRAYATSLSASETCNIGFSDYSSGESLAVAVNLVEYEALELYVGVGKPTVGVRASTYSNPGWSTIEVDGAYRITNIR